MITIMNMIIIILFNSKSVSFVSFPLSFKFEELLSGTSLTSRKHLNDFGRQKYFIMKAGTELYCRQIAEKFSLKSPLCNANLENVIQDQFVVFCSFSEFRVPLLNKLI